MGARYAQALYDLAEQGGAVANVEADLTGLVQIARREPSTSAALLDSPTIGADDKAKGLLAIAGPPPRCRP